MVLPTCIRLPCCASRVAQADGARTQAPAGALLEHAGWSRIACFAGRHSRQLGSYVGVRCTRRRFVGVVWRAGEGGSRRRGDSCVSTALSFSEPEGDEGSNDSTRLSDAVAEAAAARIDLALSLQRERDLAARLEALQSEASSLRQAAERAVATASTQLEAREAAAKKEQTAEAEAELRRAAASAAARVRQLEDELAATTVRAERELRAALAQATADAAATLANAVAASKAVAAAAEARAAALENQLKGTEELASRLTVTLQAKASADNDVATLVTANAALSKELATLRAARAEAEMRATDGEARCAAAERSVAERVRDTLAAAESCVAAAEAVKVETELRANAAAVRAAEELQAARTRADVAEAELGRRELLLGSYADVTATAAAQRVELQAASQRISALEAECATLREARAASDEAAASAQARALAAEAAVAADVARLVEANDEKWRATDSMVAARAVQLPLELALARADAAGAAATAAAATEALEALKASTERQTASLQRALQSAERSLADWKSRALALEAGADKDKQTRAPGRLRATLRDVELRRLLAQGPRGESSRPVLDYYDEVVEAATPEADE